MKLSDLSPSPRARGARKRVGRGLGSGHGKMCGRGQKGQRARGKLRPGFEGGQTPLHRRLPKLRGVSKGSMPLGPFRREYAVVNVGQLECFDSGSAVTPEALKERRIVKQLRDGLRVLGQGHLTKALTVKAHHFSGSAVAKIQAAGGTVEVI